jgi:hypothetical protein
VNSSWIPAEIEFAALDNRQVRRDMEIGAPLVVYAERNAFGPQCFFSACRGAALEANLGPSRNVRRQRD